MRGKIFFSLFAAMLLSIFVFAQDYTDFKFKSGITYSMSNAKAGGNGGAENQMTLWFADNQYSGIEMSAGPGFFMVYDSKNQRVVNVMPAQKMYMVMDMKKMKEKMKANGSANDNEKPTITKTGKTEKILGYTCEQYLVKTSKAESLVWVTKELGLDSGAFARAFSEMMGSQPGGKFGNTFGINGVMLKMEVTSTESKDKATIEATSIHKDGKALNVAGFKKMDMPGQ